MFFAGRCDVKLHMLTRQYFFPSSMSILHQVPRSEAFHPVGTEAQRECLVPSYESVICACLVTGNFSPLGAGASLYPCRVLGHDESAVRLDVRKPVGPYEHVC
jgi:hypothetical protein